LFLFIFNCKKIKVVLKNFQGLHIRWFNRISVTIYFTVIGKYTPGVQRSSRTSWNWIWML